MPTPEGDIDVAVVFCFCFKDRNNICLWAAVTSSPADVCERPAFCIRLSKASSEIFSVFAKSLTVIILYLNQCSLDFIISDEASSSVISMISKSSSVASSARSSLLFMPTAFNLEISSDVSSRSLNDS